MEIKISEEIYDKSVQMKSSGNNEDCKNFRLKKWVALNDEVKEALALYFHLKNHTEVKESKSYKGMPMCKICNKSAYQIMCEEFEKIIEEE